MNDRGITASDTFDGGPGDDIYNGTPGDDVVHGNGGNDTLNGAGGRDTLYGGDGNDHIDGGDGDDAIYGGQGADTLSGGAGDDVFVIELPTDVAAGETIDGGSGSNRLAILNSAYYLFDLSAATITNVQSIVTALNGQIWVGMTVAQLQGVNYFRGAFQLTSAGSVSMNGVDIGSGVTGFTMSAAGNVFDLTGAVGTSAGLIGNSGNDTITSNAGDDYIAGKDGNDVINGAAGNDYLYGNGGVDEIHGGAGDDILYINDPADMAPGEVYDGGTDTDTLSILLNGYGATADLTSVTLSGIERIDAGIYNYVTITITTAQLAGVTFLQAGWTVLANGGAISFSGTTVNSAIRLADAGNAIDLTGVTSNGNTVFGQGGADTITGSSKADLLQGSGGNDVINGGGGDDWIAGGAGADQLSGGTGDDQIHITNAADFVAGENYDGGSGTDTLYFDQTDGRIDISGATLTGIEVINTVYPGIALSTTQLQGLTGAYGIFLLTNGGAVSMSGINLGANPNDVFTLSAAGNSFDLTGAIGGASSVTGGIGNDTITGNDLNDSFSGEDGNDVLHGGLGADYLAGDNGNDTIDGGAGDDQIVGGSGADIVSGGNGDDTFRVNGTTDLVAGDQIDGGAGTDTIRITAGNADLSAVSITGTEWISNQFGSLSLTAAQIGQFSSIYASALTATTGGTISLGGTTLNVYQIYLANAGNTLDLSVANVGTQLQIYGAAGADVITATSSIDTISGGGGDDTLNGAGGNDVISGDAGNDTIDGGDGADSIAGGAGADILHGGAGDDVFSVDVAADVVAGEQYDGGAGSDRLQFFFGSGSGNVDLSAVSLVNLEAIDIADNSSVLLTAAQMDSLQFAGGTFTLTTGGTVSMQDTLVRAFTINLAAAGNVFDGAGSAGEFRVNGNSGNDTIIGSTAGDYLSGGGGGDQISGGFGDDQLTGGGGADTLAGGNGNDTFLVNDGTEIVAGEQIDGGAGTDTLRIVNPPAQLDISAVSITGIEALVTYQGYGNTYLLLTAAQLDAFTNITASSLKLTTGGAVSMAGVTASLVGSIQLAAAGNSLDLTGAVVSNNAYVPNPGFYVIGDIGNDIITGGAFADTILGGGGNDTINGGDGNDNLTGGAGADAINGGDGNDIISYDGAGDFAVGETIDGGAGFDIIRVSFFSIDLSSASLNGIEGIDTVYYTNVGVSLTAAQLDALTAVSGNFTLTTGGSVSMAGVVAANPNGSNSLTFTLSAAGNVFDMTGYVVPVTNVFGQDGDDVITGSAGYDNIVGGGGNDIINGGGSNDFIGGGLGADTLSGAAGDDTLDGGAEADSLVGGAGNDTLNGGAGIDTAVFSGNHTDYTITFSPDSQSFAIADQRAGSPDGTDTIRQIELLQFTDGIYVYDSQGDLLPQTVHNADGTTSVTQLDTLGTAPWIKQVSGFDAQGSLANQTVYNHNGAVWENGYDTTSTANWSWYTTAYNSSHSLVSQTGLYDNGTHWLTLFDASNAYSWSNVTIYFDANWNQYALTGINDNGSTNVTMSDIAAAYDTLLWFTAPYDPNFNAAPQDMVLTGGNGADILYGHGGNDTLSGGGGDDVLFGESGADIFVFEHGTGGEVIGDSPAGTDKIDLTAFGFADYQTVINSMHEVNGTTAIDLGGGDFIVLNGVAQASLHAGDFILGRGIAGVSPAPLAIDVHSQAHLLFDSERGNHLASMPAAIHAGEWFA